MFPTVATNQNIFKRAGRWTRVPEIIRQFIQLNPELPAFKVGIDRQDAVHDQVTTRHHVGEDSVRTLVGIGRILRFPNATDQQATIEDDPAGRIGVLNLIRSIAYVVVISIQPLTAFEEIVAKPADKNVVLPASDEMVSAIFPLQAIDAIIPDDEIIEIVPLAVKIVCACQREVFDIGTEREAHRTLDRITPVISTF